MELMMELAALSLALRAMHMAGALKPGTPLRKRGLGFFA